MKSLFISISLIFWVFCSAASTIDITEAIKLGKIKVAPTFSKLGHKGITLTVSNITPQSMNIAIPGGTTFSPAGEDEQILMNIEEVQLALNAGETKSVLVGGYCTQLRNTTPSLDNTFKIGKTSNALLLGFLDFLKTNKPSPTNYQAAVWALTDNESIASIEVMNPADQQLREYIAKQTSRSNPWYSNKQQIHAEPGRIIQRNSVSITGDLEFSLNETTHFEIVVVNSNNEVKMGLPSKEPIIKNIKHTFRFSVTVRGWESGQYHVLIRKKSDGSKIASYPFEV